MAWWFARRFGWRGRSSRIRRDREARYTTSTKGRERSSGFARAKRVPVPVESEPAVMLQRAGAVVLVRAPVDRHTVSPASAVGLQQAPMRSCMETPQDCAQLGLDYEELQRARRSH